MAPVNFRAIFNPRESKYVGATDPLTVSIPSLETVERYRPALTLLQFFLKDLFSVQGWLILGAIAQTLVFLILPTTYALIPIALLTLRSVLSTIIQVFQPTGNDYNQDVALGRTTAQPPNSSYDPDSPDDRPIFGSKPAPEPLVVFHLGSRSNHPLGPLAPGVKQVGEHFRAMTTELVDRAEHFGCVGHSAWRAAERANHNSSMIVFYFRNVEGLNAFAHDKVHRKGWDWYNSFIKETGFKHIGIFHETFSVAAGQYETIYDNMPPLLLGKTNWPVKNEKTGKQEFVVPLVDCNTSTLRSQYNRLGRSKGAAKQEY
jgi:hypothetical protein